MRTLELSVGNEPALSTFNVIGASTTDSGRAGSK